jgi:thiol:disulfide interchange protein
MDTLKQVLAFPLYATVVWLVWVLGQQAGIDAVARLLAAFVAIAAALWAVAHWAQASVVVRLGVRVVAAAITIGALVFAWPQAAPTARAEASGSAWEPWSEARVQAVLAEGKPVFVDFTAAWCVTCQVNKRLVLNAQEVDRRFAELQVTRLRADWTNRNPAITAALARMNRSGVPVYALYVPPQREPVLLPEVLTRSVVLDALQGVATQPALNRKPGPDQTRTSVATKEPL